MLRAEAIQQLDSTRHQRLSVMDQVRPGIKDLAGWLAEQWDRGTFQGPALGPLGMEMTLRDAGSHARVVEAVRVAGSCMLVGRRGSGSRAFKSALGPVARIGLATQAPFVPLPHLYRALALPVPCPCPRLAATCCWTLP